MSPLVNALNLAVTKDGQSLQDLFNAIVDPRYIKYTNNYLIIDAEYFDEGISWVPPEHLWEYQNNPYYESRVTSPARHKLEIILQYLIFGPLRNVAHSGAKLKRVGPLRIIPKHEQLQFFSNNDYSFALPIEEPFTSNDDGYEAWKYIASNQKARHRYENEKERFALDIINEWLSSPNRLALDYSIERVTRDISDAPISNTEDSPPWRDRGTQAEKASNIVFIKIINTRLGLNMAVHDVGVGIAQLVPVLVSGLANIQTFTEQPELHLHPRLQMQLADFFASTWNLSGHRSIIETHSEYIALRLLRRLRETSRKNIESNEFSRP